MSLAARFGKGFFFVRGEWKIKYSRVRFPGFSTFSEIMRFPIWPGVGFNSASKSVGSACWRGYTLNSFFFSHKNDDFR